jgi:hypothetical protein
MLRTSATTNQTRKRFKRLETTQSAGIARDCDAEPGAGVALEPDEVRQNTMQTGQHPVPAAAC